MKLISLKLLNYRRFTQQEIYFLDDFSIIYGKNGSGKSSIFDAIGFALFGPKGNDFVRLNRENLKSHFVKERLPSKVELVFQMGMDEYKIVRIIDPGVKKFASHFIPESKDILTGPNNLEILGGDEITGEIEKITGVEKNTFLKSIFTKQKDLEVLSGPLQERKNLINSILGLDSLEELIDDFKKQEKTSKTKLEVYKSKLEAFDEEHFKNNLKNAEEILKNFKKEKISKQENLEKFLKNFKKTTLDFEASNKISEQFNRFDKNLASLLGDKKNTIVFLENISKELISIEKIEKEISSQKDLEKDIKQAENQEKYYLEQKNLFTQKEILIKENEKYEIQKQEFLKQKESFAKIDFGKKTQELSEKLEILEKDFGEKNAQISTFEHQKKEVEKLGKELSSQLEIFEKLGSNSHCPTCFQTLGNEFEKVIENYKHQIGEKRAQYSEISKKITDERIIGEEIQKQIIQTKKDIEDIAKDLKNLEILENNLSNITQNITQNTAKISDLGEVKYDENEHKKHREYLEKIKQEFAIYQKNLGIISKKQEVLETQISQNILKEKLEKEIGERESEIKKLNFSPEKHQEIIERYKIESQERITREKEILEIEKHIHSQEFEIKNIQKGLQDFENDKKIFSGELIEIEKFGLKKEIISAYRNYLLSALKPKVEDIASKYFSLITDGKYASLSLDDDYNISIDGKNIALYSGGEQDLANLCLRLSLGQNMTSKRGNPINFLVLDEVLSSQDTSRQQNILINLKKLSSKFSQILLVSHIEELKDFAQNLIEVRQKDRDESEIIIQ